ncbi:MAG: hypothetical protein V3W18_00420 [candidate division Zixibacteria bacterium]
MMMTSIKLFAGRAAILSGRSAESQRGTILVMATVLSFGMFLLGLSYLGSVQSIQHDVSYELSDTQAFYAAYAGLADAELEVRTGRIGFNHLGNWVNYYGQTGYQKGVRPGQINNFNFGIATGFTVTGIGTSTYYGWNDNSQRTLNKSFEISTYADYLYISDRERDPVRNDIISFWTPDTLDGKVHSNDTLHFSGSPRFMKRVTSSASVIVPSNTYAQFDEGLGLNASEIVFPNQADEIRNNNGYPGWGTHDPDSLTEITFDGINIYRRYCGEDSLGNFTCSPAQIRNAFFVTTPVTGALFIEGKVIVKADRGGADIMDNSFTSMGFEGQMTLASSDTMIIPDNLVYRWANGDNSVPTNIIDVLGLISENFIMIGENVDDTVYINAAMASINGSITVQDIYRYGYSNEKQSLFIYGSLAQRNRGLVHSSYGGGLRGFIEKDYHYDTRLRLNPPPHFLPILNSPSIYYEGFYDN